MDSVFEKRVLREISLLPDHWQEALLKYVKAQKRRGLKWRSLKTDTSVVTQLSKHYQGSLKTVDAETIMEWLDKTELAPKTQVTYRSVLQQVLKFLGNPVQLPRYKLPRTLPVLHSELLSPQDIKEMIQAADHPRDKAIVAVLYESAARAHELLRLTTEDITFHPQFAKIRLVGKTGERIIPLITSVPFLQDWINYKGIKSGPIWLGRSGPIHYAWLYEVIKRLAKRALGRPSRPHILRHSRLTELAKRWTGARLCQFAGWTQGSQMQRVYVHLSGADLEEALLELHGIKQVTEPVSTPLEPVECPRCQFQNPSGSMYCSQCSLVLDEDTAQHEIAKDARLRKVLKILMQDEKIMTMLRKKIKDAEK